MNSPVERANHCAAFLKSQWPANINPSNAVAVVLGSGFKGFVQFVEISKEIAFKNIPYQASAAVTGHGSTLYFGKHNGQDVIIASGRIHLYEGHSAHDCVHLLRSLALVGVRRFILTNASGSVQKSIAPGQACLIADQINLSGHNSLASSGIEPMFVNMVDAYDPDWRQSLKTLLPSLRDATYCGLLGPSYETPAETRAFASMGADLVGMSTVQETLALRQLGCRVLGISFVTNYAGGLAQAVDHQEVLEQGAQNASALAQLLGQAISCIPHRN